MQNQTMSEIKVESFWGAISSFVLLQIFGYVIFHTFIVSINPENTMGIGIILGLVFILVFMFFQSDAFFKIKSFLRANNNPKESLSQNDEKIKLFLAVVFGIILLLMILGYNPLFENNVSVHLIIVFYALSWAISWAMAKLRKNKIPVLVASGGNRIAGIIMGSFFFILGISLKNIDAGAELIPIQNYAYFLGLLGLGIVITLVSTILLEDQKI